MAGCSSDIEKPFSHHNKVFIVFQRFNAKKPLVIPYLGTDIPQDITKTSVIKQIRGILARKYPDIFTKTVLQQITFQNAKLKPGVSIAVQAKYQNNTKKIYVREESNPHSFKNIYDALGTCTTQQPLVVSYLGEHPNTNQQNVIDALRETLTKRAPEVLTATVVDNIYFDDIELKPNTAVEVQAKYQNNTKQIYVQEASNPHVYKPIYDALGTCTAQQPLVVSYLGEHPNTNQQNVIDALRETLTKRAPEVLTATVVDNIYFDDIELKPNTAVAVGATYQKITKQIYVQEASNQVFSVLKQFSQATSSLNINYLGPAHETLSAKTTIVTQAVKQALKKVNPIFTDQCLSNISLGNTKIMPGKPVKVTVVYHLNHYDDQMDIYIKEHLSSLKETAYDIANKIQLGVHLKKFCSQKMMNNPAVAENIRQVIVGQKILSASEAQYVQPQHKMIINNHKYRLRVIKDGKTVYSPLNPFFVHQNSKIIHWESSDYTLHFIAYFTPSDYILLRKILGLQSKHYFLGAFLQMLNDAQFDWERQDWAKYCIPTKKEMYNLPGYRHIFQWDNRLDQYMGHFGSWDEGFIRTADRMIRINKCTAGHCYWICEHASILRDWLKKWLKNHDEHHNNGVMMNLKWEFDSVGFDTKYTFDYGDSALW